MAARLFGIKAQGLFWRSSLRLSIASRLEGNTTQCIPHRSLAFVSRGHSLPTRSPAASLLNATSLSSEPSSHLLFITQRRTVKPGKSHKGARARMLLKGGRSALATKAIERYRQGKQHLNEHKGRTRVKKLGKPTVVHKHDRKRVLRLLLNC